MVVDWNKVQDGDIDGGCEGGNCGPPPGAYDAGETFEEMEEGGDAAAQKKSLCVSVLTLLISIPALIGACCWPALVIGLLSGTVSAAARKLGHVISLAVTGFMMLLVIGFIWYSLRHRSRRRGCCHYYGPLILIVSSVPLILAEPMRHLLQDEGLWDECHRPNGEVWPSHCTWSSSQYECNLPGPDHCIPDSQENIGHLSMIGWLFTIVFTYSGFVLLAFGTLWNANIIQKCRKLKQDWKRMRGQRVVKAAPGDNAVAKEQQEVLIDPGSEQQV